MSVEALILQMQVDRLNADYCAALDEKRFDDWPEFFLEDGCRGQIGDGHQHMIELELRCGSHGQAAPSSSRSASMT